MQLSPIFACFVALRVRRVLPLLMVLALFTCLAFATSDAWADEPDVPSAQVPGAEEAGTPIPFRREAKHPFPRRMKSPGIEGGNGWINTAGPLDLKDLRGKFVVLDFWTYCCINCLHILPELKKLEHAYPNNVVVIGVHSAKFDTEKESQNITEAVLRHDIEHPVVNDSDHEIWRRFNVRSWPSLRVIDPEGQLVATHSGEIEFESLDAFLKSSLPYYREKGVLDETPVRFDLEREKLTPGPLHYPGKVLADETGDRLFIADSGHHRIVIADLAGKLLDVIGGGQRGWSDGDYASAQFSLPQGMALHDGHLYVADTENHLIRKVDLANKRVSTIAGTGKQNRGLPPGADKIDPNAGLEGGLPERWVSKPNEFALASPWAVLPHGDHLYIAMAGRHQIWRMTLDEKEIEIYAGSGIESITDGKLATPKPLQLMGRFFDAKEYSAFAQPSGLASDGEWLYIADSEGSAIRAVPFDQSQAVKTVVGATDKTIGPTGRPVSPLFSFGDRDGQGEAVLLQHVLGVAHHEGKLYVTDTYNNKIKEIDLAERSSQAFVGANEPGKSDQPAQFDEPEGISYAAGALYVADTNNHLIRRIDLANREVTTLTIASLQPPVRKRAKSGLTASENVIELGEVRLKPRDGAVRFDVTLKLPAGWKINTLAPASYQIDVAGEPGSLVPAEAVGAAQRLAKGDRKRQFSVTMPVSVGSGTADVSVTVRYFYCQDGAEGLCKVGDVTWQMALTLTADGDSSAKLQQ